MGMGNLVHPMKENLMYYNKFMNIMSLVTKLDTVEQIVTDTVGLWNCMLYFSHCSV